MDLQLICIQLTNYLVSRSQADRQTNHHMGSTHNTIKKNRRMYYANAGELDNVKKIVDEFDKFYPEMPC